MTSSQLPSGILSAEAPEFVPSFAGIVSKTALVDQSVVPAVSVCICEALNQLICNPEDFYEVAHYLSFRLTELIQDDDSLTIVVDEIIDQSLYVDNLQYLIARLCTFLYCKLPEDVARSFRGGLLARCKVEFDQKDNLIKTAEGCATLVKFTLFFGELMLQMTAATGDALELFPGRVIELLSSMLSVVCEETVKGVVQIIKLTGAVLQRHKPVQTDQLFEQLKNTITDDKLTSSQRRMLLSLVELRASTFSEEDSDVSHASHLVPASQHEPLAPAVEAHFSDRGDANVENAAAYFSDSSDEEIMMDMLLENYGADDFEIINSGGDQYVVPRGMDAEMEDAFEAFMANRNNTR